MKEVVGVYRGDSGLWLLVDEDGQVVYYPMCHLPDDLVGELFSWITAPDQHEPPLVHLDSASTHSELVASES